MKSFVCSLLDCLNFSLIGHFRSNKLINQTEEAQAGRYRQVSNGSCCGISLLLFSVPVFNCWIVLIIFCDDNNKISSSYAFFFILPPENN